MTLEGLQFSEHGDAVVARLAGEVDLSNASSVKDRLLHAVPNSAAALVLDLSETAYVDSSGVRLIFELAERLRSRGQRLELVVPDDSRIKRVLLLTEVQQVVSISSSLGGALGD
jgi:anti-sigma B factor antagonist